MGKAGPHLLMVVTEDWYFWSHRRSIAARALEAGYRVTLASRFGGHRDLVEAMGVETVDIAMRRSGRSPLGEARAVLDLARTYRQLRPDVVHHVAIKPVLYGALAARLAGVRRVVHAISGLGFAFTGAGAKARAFGAVARGAYRGALRGAGARTVFQNDDDRDHFVEAGLVRPEQTVLVRGSGVDLAAFTPGPEPAGRPVVLYAGRMLWSKGVGDLVAAVPLLRAAGHDPRVVLVGHSDTANPEAIPEATLHAWVAGGLVEWWGRRSDMPAVLASAHVVVLGSEREGVPKVLLEAAGAGKPIVTTDVPGCRDVVEDGVNGRLVPVHDPGALAAALGGLLADPALRARMGAASRDRAVAEFSERLVADQTLAIYRDLLAMDL